MQDHRHALHVLPNAIEELIHVSVVRQSKAPALVLQVLLQVLQVALGAGNLSRGRRVGCSGRRVLAYGYAQPVAGVEDTAARLRHAPYA